MEAQEGEEGRKEGKEGGSIEKPRKRGRRSQQRTIN
jgi:hypothetical protein